MASTQNAESSAQPPAGRRTRFVVPSAAGPASPNAPAAEPDEPARAMISRRAAIGAAGMGTAALLCFVFSAGFPGSGAATDGATAQRVTTLRAQIQAVRAQDDALPGRHDVERGLAAARTSAGQVAGLQNAYRQLAPGTAASGKLDPRAASPTRRNLVPYFAPTVAPSALDPWYLLAGDKDVPSGTGTRFDSGFAWVAQLPYAIGDNGTARVTWLAVGTRAPAGVAPPVLAWARADFDLTRRTFSNLQTGTTTTGEALRLAVTPS